MSDHTIHGECEIFVDENKSIFVTCGEEVYLLGKFQFHGGFCHFLPEQDTLFIENALVTIAQLMSKVSEMPSDEEIDGLFNDKQKDI